MITFTTDVQRSVFYIAYQARRSLSRFEIGSKGIIFISSYLTLYWWFTCEIREPRDHITSQDVITWLNHKISLNVHQHDTYCCVSTQTIQRRVIFSDIR